MGALLDRVESGVVTISLPMSSGVTQQHGYFHAGVTSPIVDTAGGYAAQTLMPENSGVLIVEYKINRVAAAIGGKLQAIGTVINPGRTLTICRLDLTPINAVRVTHT